VVTGDASPERTESEIMLDQRSGASGTGLERSGEAGPGDWIRHTAPSGGVEWLTAWLHGPAYRRHRHDTYAICLTDRGVQAFTYRGETRISLPGDVAVLHPDEAHDGHAGSDAGFGYRLLYVEPALIFDAVRSLTGAPGSLPFVPHGVITSPHLAAVIRTAFETEREPLAIDDLVVRLAKGLLAADPSGERRAPLRRLDLAAITRARQFLDAERSRVVRSWELEALSGLSRYELTRQFRRVAGTSPYRYSLMRRLEAARGRIDDEPLVDVALATGFADQAQFTRHFTAAFGLTPGRYRALRRRQAMSNGSLGSC
jgi:AraC-like DNA-binding protein